MVSLENYYHSFWVSDEVALLVEVTRLSTWIQIEIFLSCILIFFFLQFLVTSLTSLFIFSLRHRRTILLFLSDLYSEVCPIFKQVLLRWLIWWSQASIVFLGVLRNLWRNWLEVHSVSFFTSGYLVVFDMLMYFH